MVLRVAAACVLVGSVLGGCGSAGRGPAAGSHPAVPLPTPTAITRDGIAFAVHLTTPQGVALDAKDPRKVVVYSFDAYERGKPECSSFDPSARVVDETDDAVRIAAFEYRKDVPGAHNCAYATSEDDPLYRAVPLELSKPLGARRIIDARSGKAFGLIGPRTVLTPAHVPDGYRHELTSYFKPPDSLEAMTQYLDKTTNGDLEIHLVPAATAYRYGKVLGHVRIGDADGTVTDEDYEHCLSWTIAPDLVAKACTVGHGAELLPTEELAKVARSIPAPS